MRRTLAIIALIAGPITGCGHGEGPPAKDAGQDGGQRINASEPPDAANPIAQDASQDASETEDGSQRIVPGTPPDLSLWDAQWDECVHQFSPEAATEEVWELPTRTAERYFYRTPEELRAEFGTELDVYNFTSHPDLKIRSDQTILYDVWAEPGQDVVIRSTVMRSQKRWSTDGARIVATAALDYQPTNAAVALKEHPTGPDLAVGTGGVAGDFPAGYIAYIDFRFPAEAFTPGRTHELALHVNTAGPDMAGDAGRRINIHYGGYTVPTEELCADAQEMSASTQWERQFGTGGALVNAFVTPMEWRFWQLEPVVVEPGATHRVYLTFRYIDRDEVEKNIAWVPVLNGKHLSTIRFYRGGGSEKNPRGPLTTDARTFFDINFPEEPGIYEFWIAGWQDPWKRYRPIDELGIGNYPGVDSGDDYGNSNVIQFEVRE